MSSNAMISELAVSQAGSNNAKRTSLSQNVKIITNWGRHATSSTFLSIGSFLMMATMPFLILFCIHSIAHYDGSMLETAIALYAKLQQIYSTSVLDLSFIPPITQRSLVIYFMWMSFQLTLWYLVPGPNAHGQLTPAGHLLQYRVNGLNCWIVTHCLFAFATLYLGWFSAGVLHDEWLGLFSVANMFGFTMTALAYLKARFAPTHPKDCKYTGSTFYDVFMGVELNPRLFGGTFDFKLFFNGRPGIIAWTIINGSMAFKQYELHGYVSNSMIAVNILQALYVLDFFKNESWYLRTIDICHDHFGFYLAWGDCVWLPYMYTLQAFYLVQHPVNFSLPAIAAIYLLGFTGYALFRLTNRQKDWFRQKKGECLIWGKPARFIRATYFTGEGEKRVSLLLTSGFWGLSRHFNYVGDLMLSLAFCLTSGFNHLLPYFYIIYMTILLVHRVGRDDARCSAKYGETWKQYRQQVKWKILPGVY